MHANINGFVLANKYFSKGLRIVVDQLCLNGFIELKFLNVSCFLKFEFDRAKYHVCEKYRKIIKIELRN